VVDFANGLRSHCDRAGWLLLAALRRDRRIRRAAQVWRRRKGYRRT